MTSRPHPTASPPLRTVLFATATAAADIPGPPDYPAALLPLGHCSFIEHALAQLACAGIRAVELVVSARPEALRRLLGNGERWGLSLRWHLARDAKAPYGILRMFGLEAAPAVLIGHADRWIAADALAILATGESLLMLRSDPSGLAWSGWARTGPAHLSRLCGQEDEAALGAMLAQHQPTLHRLEPGQCIAARNAAELLQAQRRILQGRHLAEVPASWLRQPWGAQSPDALVQEGAIIQGPVLVGPACMVCASARIGPFTVLSRDIVVSADSLVRDSLVLPHSYVGAGLELDQAIVRGRQVQHLQWSVRTVLPASEGLLLDLSQRSPPRTGWLSRGMALSLCLLLLPWLLADGAIRRARGLPWRWQSRQVITGQDAGSGQLREQNLRCPVDAELGGASPLARYGSWLDVLQGRRSWFGARPRSLSEWSQLSPDWQLLLASTPVGCLHAPAWSDSQAECAEACAAADVFFAVRRSQAEKLRLLWTAMRTSLRR
jgi:hypothetical protein